MLEELEGCKCVLEGGPESVASLQIDSQTAVLQLHSHWPARAAHKITTQE